MCKTLDFKHGDTIEIKRLNQRKSAENNAVIKRSVSRVTRLLR